MKSRLISGQSILLLALCASLFGCAGTRATTVPDESTTERGEGASADGTASTAGSSISADGTASTAGSSISADGDNASAASGQARASAGSPSTAPSDSASSAPPFTELPYEARWYGNSVFYEIMVRSFYDFDGDGIGDLKGLTAKLDYLNTGDSKTKTDLKVDGVWLMPFFKSPSYHGYDATDYYQIDPKYGTLEDFKTMVAEAHKRGIRVILDLVLNHTSNEHPWFQRAASGDPEWRDWYVFGDSDPGWVRPWGGGPVWHKRGDDYFYGLFWEGMPDLNYNHPPVQEEMIKIGKYWLEQGADGYRLDAIRYLFEEGKGKQADLPSTLAYLKRFAREMRTVKPDAMLVGEIWSDTKDVAPYYGDGDILDLAFGFDEAGGILNAIHNSESGALLEALEKVGKNYPERRFSAPFLTNHDMPRLASLFESDVQKEKLAFSVLMSLPGTPFLYQGEEIGLFMGPRPGDEGKRTPMQWDSSPTAGFTTASSAWNELSGKQDTISVAAQEGVADSLLTFYQDMIRKRHEVDSLRIGDIKDVRRGPAGATTVLTFLRQGPEEATLCVFNFGPKKLAGIPIEVQTDLRSASDRSTPRLRAENLMTGAPIPTEPNPNAGSTTVTTPELPAFSATWVHLTQP